ncbi:MAG: hypothetical protein WED33_11805 [Bacteroidia bacterium]
MLFSALIFISGCERNKIVLCTEEIKAGINVFVNDSESLQILIQDVEVKAITGNHEEVLLRPISDASPFTGAYEKPGIYRIVTNSPGFHPDTLDPIIVDKDDCHVIPQIVYIKLRKL